MTKPQFDKLHKNAYYLEYWNSNFSWSTKPEAQSARTEILDVWREMGQSVDTSCMQCVADCVKGVYALYAKAKVEFLTGTHEETQPSLITPVKKGGRPKSRQV